MAKSRIRYILVPKRAYKDLKEDKSERRNNTNLNFLKVSESDIKTGQSFARGRNSISLNSRLRQIDSLESNSSRK